MVPIGSFELVTNYTVNYIILRYFHLKLGIGKAAIDYLHTEDD